MKVAFLVWNRFMLNHFSLIARQFEEPDFIFFDRDDSCIQPEDLVVIEEAGAFLRFSKEYKLHKIANEYDIIISTNVLHSARPIESKFVIMQYGLAKASNQFDARWCAADLGLVYGRYSSDALAGVCPVVEVGNPRFDDFFNDSLKPEVLEKIREKLDPEKKTLLYSPTWGDLSSLPRFENAINKLLEKYNLIYNYHHLSGLRGQYSTGLIEAGAITVDDFDYTVDFAPYFLSVCDLVLSDMSGAIFDALYCGRRVLLLDNEFDQELGHKKAEKDTPEVQLRRNVCAYLTDPEKLLTTVSEELSKEFYNNFDIDYYFSARGDSAKIAADAIYALHYGEVGRPFDGRHVPSTVRKIMAIRAKFVEARKRNYDLWDLYALSNAKKANVNLSAKLVVHASKRFSVLIRKFDTALLLMLGKISSMSGGKLRGLLERRNEKRSLARVARYLATEYEKREDYKSASKVLMPTIGKKHYLARRHADIASRAKDVHALVSICEFLLKKGGAARFSLFFDLASSCRFSRTALSEYFRLLEISTPISDLEGNPSRWAVQLPQMLSLGLFSFIPRDNEYFLAWKKSREWQVTEERLACVELAFRNAISNRSEFRILSGDCKKFLPIGKTNPVEVFVPRSLLFSFDKESVLRNQAFTANITFNLIDTLLALGVDVLPRMQGHWGAKGAPMTAPYSKMFRSITWHTCSRYKNNRLHLKYGTLPGFFSLDPMGYAGFSEYPDRGVSRPPLPEQAKMFFSKVQYELVANRISKYAQNKSADDIRFEHYIFYPLQVVSDSVAVLQYASPLDYLDELIKWGSVNRVGIVVKRHPKCVNMSVAKYLESLKKNPAVQVSDADVHDLISKSDAVFTINSGSGAEALLHSKPVFLGGRADYQAATTHVPSPKDIHLIFDEFLRSGARFSQEEVEAFVYSYTHDYMVGHDDVESMRLLLNDYGWVDPTVERQTV